jgi:hypothetical protein
MRRVVFLVIACLAAWHAAPAGAQTVTFGVGGELSGELGGYVRVPVYADLSGAPGQKLGAYRLRLVWDPLILRILDYQNDIEPGRFGEGIVDADSAYSFGILKVGGLAAAGLDGLFDLFAIRFYVLQDATSAVTLTVTEAVAAGTFADLLPFVTVANATYCPAVGRWGDLDGDGLANSRDALAILSAIVGLTPPPGFTLAMGDVDGSASVNSRDALITLSYAVGLDIPGHRVLVLAPGTCGTGGANGITLLPDAVDVVIGQRVQLLMLSSAGGTPSTGSATWSTGDPAVASVTADGLLAGAQVGATTVTAALGPGIQATVPVTVRAQRFVWYVDATQATFAAVQLGTAQYPFSTPEYAFPHVRDGDTVLVAPGVHDLIGTNVCYYYDFYCDAAPGPFRSVVLMGDTLPDGTRPVLRGNPDVSEAVLVDRSIRLEIRDLVFTNFDAYAIRYSDYYDAPPAGAPGARNAAETVDRTLVLENVEIESTRYGGGLYLQGLDTLRIRGSEFTCSASATEYCYEPIVSYYTRLADIEGSRFIGGTQSDYYYYYRSEFYYGDSLVARDNEFFALAGLYVDGDDYRGGTALTIARNRFSDSAASVGAYYYYGGLEGYDLRSAVLDHNRFDYRFGTDYAVQLYGLYPDQPGSFARLLGDSIAVGDPGSTSYGYWYDIQDFDSIAVDSLKATAPAGVNYPYGGYLGARRVRVTDSKFLGSYNPLEVGADTVEVVNSQFVNCAGCAGASSSYGIEVYPYADSTRMLRVDGSSFTGFNYSVFTNYYQSVRVAELTGNTVDSTLNGFYIFADSARILDNVFTRSARPLTVADYSPVSVKWASILRNQVGCTRGSWGYSDTWGLYLVDVSALADSNQITGCRVGVYYSTYYGNRPHQLSMRGNTLTADPTLGDTPYGLYLPYEIATALRNNRITGGSYGIAYLGTGAHTLDSNVISGTATYAVYASGTGAVAGRWNNVKNNVSGFYAAGSGARSLTDGRFVGNTGYAVYAPSLPVTATNNWWGDPGGPFSGVADSVYAPSENVAVDPFLTSDPEGGSVPLSPPALNALLAGPQAGAVGTGRVGAPPTPPALPDVRPGTQAQAERQARREEAQRRREETRSRAEQRGNQLRSKGPQ